jgi:hypothetical protein
MDFVLFDLITCQSSQCCQQRTLSRVSLFSRTVVPKEWGHLHAQFTCLGEACTDDLGELDLKYSEGRLMIAKCCNPSRDAVFRYLYYGRVFVLANDPAVGIETSKRPEYFWLCQQCSSKMTLRLGEEAPVVAMLLVHEIQEKPRWS